jgi:uncharacterized protein (UPF0261 family)
MQPVIHAVETMDTAAGLNIVPEKILSNAAHAMAGMVAHQVASRETPTAY